MAVKIKLKRLGKIREPHYRIVVADARTKRDGRAIEEIGKYHPKEEPSLIEVNSERAQYWLGVGAQPTEPVAAILKVTGDWQKFKGLPAPRARCASPSRKGGQEGGVRGRRQGRRPASAKAERRRRRRRPPAEGQAAEAEAEAAGRGRRGTRGRRPPPRLRPPRPRRETAAAEAARARPRAEAPSPRR